ALHECNDTLKTGLWRCVLAKRIVPPVLSEQRRRTMTTNAAKKTTLIVGGAGKTGRRVAERLARRGLPYRMGSRSGAPPFDWNDETTWTAALADVGAAYITFYPDLAVPWAADKVRRFVRRAVDGGVGKLVLLAGRGEPQVRPAEEAVRESDVAYTILEAAFF